nr:hypothetical protein [Nocardia transvalensis]
MLQPYGFHGSEPLWVRVRPAGVASVGRTRVARTWTGGRQVLRFGLELNATPLAWWEYCNWRNARLGLPEVPLEHASGPGLAGAETLSAELTEPWSLRVDPEQPGQHVLQSDLDAIRADLPRRVHAYARRALRLVEPDRYLAELTSRPDAGSAAREAIVVLLADRGPGPDLDEAIAHLRLCHTDGDSRTYADDLIAYARSRAALV